MSHALRIHLDRRRDLLDAQIAARGGLPQRDRVGWEMPYLYRKVVKELRADRELAGLRVTELAERLDVDPATVYRALAAVDVQAELLPGRRRRRWHNRENCTERAVRYIEQHGTRRLSDRVLARELSVSPHTVRRARRMLGLPGLQVGRPRGPAERDERIVEMRDAEGLTFSEIGRRIGMTRQGVHRRYRLAIERAG